MQLITLIIALTGMVFGGLALIRQYLGDHENDNDRHNTKNENL